MRDGAGLPLHNVPYHGAEAGLFAGDNALELAMARAAADGGAAGDFYHQLMKSPLIVLGVKNGRLEIDTVRNGQGVFHPVFTSPSRLSAFGAAQAPHFEIDGRTLFEATKGAQFVVNPRSPLAKTLSAEEIAWCLETFAAAEIAFYQPKVYPTRLVKALCVLFTSRNQIRSARLTYAARPGRDPEPHIVIGIEAEAEVPRLAQEIFMAAEAANPGQTVEVVDLSPDGLAAGGLAAGDQAAGGAHPVQNHLMRIPPFYSRAVALH
jgi:SseB protein.